MDRTDSIISDTLPVVTEESYSPDGAVDYNNHKDDYGGSMEHEGDMGGRNGSINTAREYALMESGNNDHKSSAKSRVKRRSFLDSRQFKSFRSASLSVSMLEKPSDDRKAHAFLAGWNVSNLIQGTGILGVPYAVQQGGWAAVAMIFVVAILCCHTGKLLVDCMYEKSKKTGIRRRLRINYPAVSYTHLTLPTILLV